MHLRVFFKYINTFIIHIFIDLETQEVDIKTKSKTQSEIHDITKIFILVQVEMVGKVVAHDVYR